MDDQASGGGGAYVRRFSGFQRILHLCLMISFLGLAGTGMPLLFSHARWAWWLSRMWGGYAVASALHRFFAFILIVTFVVHVGSIFYRVVVKRDYGLLWGPRSMVPQPGDLKDLIAHVRWFVRGGTRPQFDHFTYWEKFDYWAVFWGMFIIGGTGLIMWFPGAFAAFLPGWMLNICEVIHGEEALLAVGFIFTVHFFNGHLRPGKFPMDLVMFTGRMPRHELENERRLEYERLLKEGKLEGLAVPPPSPEIVLAGKVVGTIAVLLGLGMVVMIIWAVLH